MEADLFNCVIERDTLKAAKETDAAEIKWLSRERLEAASQVSAAKEELRQAAEIISAAFSDLPHSAKEVCQFFNANPDAAYKQQKLFWLQFQDPARFVLLGDRLKQLEELQKVARPAMEDLCRALWRKDPVPTSYFRLVHRLQEGRDRVDRWKTSACIEGARQAFAAV